MMRYLRLFSALARYALLREMAFRGNFLVKVLVEVIWLGIILAFYQVVFARTNAIAGWSQSEYLFFVGCFFAINGLIEMFFLDNCNEFANLVRTGDLDFLLIKPIDEQFLISFRKMDWGVAPNVLMGAGLMSHSLYQLGWQFDLLRVAAFTIVFACGVGLSYAFMLMLTSLSVWLVRNQSVMEMWWLCTNLARYPREIFRAGTWAEPIGFILTFILPFLLIVNVPASVIVKVFDPVLIAYAILLSAAMVSLSRWFFKWALRSYRSASS